MATGAFAGVGTVFQRWSGAAWVDIAEINSIEGPSMDKDTIEVTSLETQGGYEEYITGFIDGGQVVLNMNFTRSGYELMKSDFEVDVLRDYRIWLNDGEDTSLEFEGLVIEIPLTMAAEDKLTADVTIQVSGQVALDVGSSGAPASEESSTPASSDDTEWPEAMNDGKTLGFFDALDESTMEFLDIGADSSASVGPHVRKWFDKLGSGSKLTQEVTWNPLNEQAPTLEEGVRFRGSAMNPSSMRYEPGAGDSAGFDLPEPVMVYLVMKNVSYANNDVIFDGVDYASKMHQLRQSAASTNLRLYDNVGNSGNIACPDLGNWFIIKVWWDAANTYAQVNEAAAVAWAAHTETDFDGFYLGARGPGNGGYADIEVKAVILRTSSDGAADIFNYLKTKYGVTY